MTSLLATELNYLRCFCGAEALSYGLRLRDERVTDMFSHNLTYLTQPLSADELIEVYRIEAQIRKKEGHPFLNLTFDFPRPPKVQAHFTAMRGEITAFDYYVYSGAPLYARQDCAVLPMTPPLCADALAFDLSVNGGDFGRDFIRRRFERRSAVYLQGEVQHFLCYHAGRVVGMCDLYVDGEHAKIEDFDVAAPYQRQGFGKAILAHLIRRARRQGAKTIYLITDDADTAKNMYEKSGFVFAAQKHEFVLPVYG